MAGNHMMRANASRFFVAGELSRRGFSALVTTGRTSKAHVLCSNVDGTKTVHIQVRTYEPGYGSCMVGTKAGDFLGDNYFWVLAGIPNPGEPGEFEYYIIPNRVMAENEPKYHRLWLETPGRNGLAHNDNATRVVLLPPSTSPYYWDISQYHNNWDLIAEKLP